MPPLDSNSESVSLSNSPSSAGAVAEKHYPKRLDLMPLTRIGTLDTYLGQYMREVRQRVLPVRFFGFVHGIQGDGKYMCPDFDCVLSPESFGRKTREKN